MDREERIQHAMDFLCDMFPYDDPNYIELLREAAENYVDWEDSGCPVIDTDWLNSDDCEIDDELPF